MSTQPAAPLSGLLPYALACAATYRSGAVPTIQDDSKLTHVFLSTVAGRPCVAFEGTVSWEEWVFRDFFCAEVPLLHHPRLGPVHAGIAIGVMNVLDKVCAWLESHGWPDYDATGHSKGGGEALIFAGMMKDRGHAPRKVAAFEPPHVGTQTLAAWLADVDCDQTQTYNAEGADLVTLVPWGDIGPNWDWTTVTPPLRLAVPDSYGIPEKHRIPAVIGALGA